MRETKTLETRCFSKPVTKGGAGEIALLCVLCTAGGLKPAVTIGSYGSSLDRK